MIKIEFQVNAFKSHSTNRKNRQTPLNALSEPHLRMVTEIPGNGNAIDRERV